MLVNFYWPGKNNRPIQNVIKAHVVLDQPVVKSRPRPEKKVAKPVENRQADKIKKAAALKKIQLEKKQRQEKLQAEKAKKAAALKKKQLVEKRRQQEAHKQLMQELAAEEQERKTQANETRALAAMSQFEGLIRQRVTRNWNQPSGVPAGLSCLLRVRLAAGGEVLGVSVIQSSGNAVFDRSVENAVYKAAPLPVPDDPELFKFVREINIRFDPED